MRHRRYPGCTAERLHRVALTVCGRRSDPEVAKTIANNTVNPIGVQQTVDKSANNADVPVELVHDILSETVRVSLLPRALCSLRDTKLACHNCLPATGKTAYNSRKLARSLMPAAVHRRGRERPRHSRLCPRLGRWACASARQTSGASRLPAGQPQPTTSWPPRLPSTRHSRRVFQISRASRQGSGSAASC